ncbi:MAG: SDR family NAD(P)-dependent oxidoreductase [Hyphomicrobiaceae bacterium]
MRFENRIAIVTGAWHIGRAIAAGLAAEGAHVLVADIDAAAAKATADEITVLAGSAEPLQADVTDAADCAHLIAAAGGAREGASTSSSTMPASMSAPICATSPTRTG